LQSTFHTLGKSIIGNDLKGSQWLHVLLMTRMIKFLWPRGRNNCVLLALMSAFWLPTFDWCHWSWITIRLCFMSAIYNCKWAKLKSKGDNVAYSQRMLKVLW